METTRTKLSRAEVAKLVRTREHYHLAMRKAGYDMPSLSSSMCSLKFMQKARKGIYFIPKRSDTANIK